jgi:phosphohistidine phosphatase
MKLYLVRHGESVATGADDVRPLSEKGKEDIGYLANFIIPLNIQVARIVHSEKYRARQTAEILATSVSLAAMMEKSVDLDPLASIAPMLNQIDAWDGDSLLVGHMPFMGRLVSKLTSGDEDNNVVIFKPGNMVCLEQIEKRRWSICWMLSPVILQ